MCDVRLQAMADGKLKGMTVRVEPEEADRIDHDEERRVAMAKWREHNRRVMREINPNFKTESTLLGES